MTNGRRLSKIAALIPVTGGTPGGVFGYAQSTGVLDTAPVWSATGSAGYERQGENLWNWCVRQVTCRR